MINDKFSIKFVFNVNDQCKILNEKFSMKILDENAVSNAKLLYEKVGKCVMKMLNKNS